MRTPGLVPVICALALGASGAGADEPLWRPVAEATAGRPAPERVLPAGRYGVFALDRDALGAILDAAPLEFTDAAERERTLLLLPLPDGRLSLFRIEASPILAPELEAQFPEIRTFRGQGLTDRTASVRFDLTPRGFHAMILSGEGTVFVDPYGPDDIDHYVSYFKRDYERAGGSPFRCLVHDVSPQDARGDVVQALPNGGTLRRTAWRWPPPASTRRPSARPTRRPSPAAWRPWHVSMNRVNGVYERELAIRMILVANNNLRRLHQRRHRSRTPTTTASRCSARTRPTSTRVIGSGQLRHRPRVQHRRRRRRRPRRRLRQRQQGPRRHRQPRPGRRRLRHRLRGPRDGPPVRRQPHLQRHHRQLRRRQSQRARRPTSRAAAPRSWPTPASAAPRTSSRTATTTSTSGSLDEIDVLHPDGRAAPRAAPTAPPATRRRRSTRARTFTIPQAARRSPSRRSATDPNGDTLTYDWEEFDLGHGGAAQHRQREPPDLPLLRPRRRARADVPAALRHPEQRQHPARQPRRRIPAHVHAHA